MECRNLVGGSWISPESGATFDVRDPATGELIARVPRGGAAEAHRCVDAAEQALPEWSARSPAMRAGFLDQVSSALRRARTELAALITRESGKPLAESAAEVDYSADYFDSAAAEARNLVEVRLPVRGGGTLKRAIPEPVGVVAAITPWNFPLAMIARKTAPALAAGCTQVVKPAEATPLTALTLAQLATDAGLPPGVLNVITGDPPSIARAWLGDGRVRKLSFTGSTRVGKELMRLAADQVVRLSLELGGQAPLIVFGDADLDAAVAAAIAGKFRVAGQTCICPNRFLVAREVHAEFTDRLVRAATRLPVGPGTLAGVRIGPLINDEAVTKVRRHVADAIDRGGVLRCGGGTVPVDGCLDRFFAPTVIDSATPEMLCFKEETFGPVAPIAGFDSIDDAVTLANATEFGLAAYIFTRDLACAERVGAKLRSGIVGVNTCAVSDAYAPFGGCQWSGFGREGGRWGLEEYLAWKYVCATSS
ncbi:MAG: NAD-dependent succinate-semialdehyde dehydrogenase [Phycisphaerales bacterium]|nr:NAD-dependent succinate-semialdehyde dehydrogenase [Phycisphaerales bacterium]